jgi:hypothetical protein
MKYRVKVVIDFSTLRQMALKKSLNHRVTFARFNRIPLAKTNGVSVYHEGRKAEGIQQYRIGGFLPDTLC